MSEISASILDCNYDEIDIEIKKINESGVKYIHRYNGWVFCR